MELLNLRQEVQIRNFRQFLQTEVRYVDDLFPPPPDNVRELRKPRLPPRPPAEAYLSQVALCGTLETAGELVLI